MSVRRIAAVPSRAWTLRMAALMGAGAFGVHQLRFAFISEDAQALNGHGYLAPLGAVLVGLLLYASAAALARIARGVVDEAPRLRRLWAGTSACLVAVYCVQESLEVMLTHGQSLGMFQRGGWVALPLALGVGLLIALVMRGAAVVSALAAEPRRRRLAPWAARATLGAVLPPWTPRRTRAGARHLAARGPPLASA
jgi:hypothetical protein